LTSRSTVANVHRGGSIRDVTADLSDVLARAAVAACEAIDIPVAGVDLMAPDVAGDTYAIIEVNERPGLANHEPHPVVERWFDLLFA
jgi:D-alanine-D-alanine ligase-like ATP-grasp enzyme